MKEAKPMSIFGPIKAKLADKPTAAALAAALDDLSAIDDKLKSQHAEIAQRRNDTLLTASEADLAESREAMAAIADQREVAGAFRAKIAADHIAALADEEQIRRREAYDAAMAKVAAAKTFQRDFDRAARAMAAAMSTLMEAKLAATAANEFLPAGAEPMTDPEWALGCIPGEAKKVLKEETIALWCMEDSFTPVSQQHRIATGGANLDRGYLPSESGLVAGNIPVVRRTFLRREILPQTDAVWADPISQTLCVPGWITPPMRGPHQLEPAGYLATIAAMVASHDAAPAPMARRKAFEIVPVTEDGEVHEAQAARGAHVEAVALAATPRKAA